MSEYEASHESSAKPASGQKTLLLVIAGLYILASLYLLVDVRGRVATLETGQATVTATQQEVKQQMASTESTLQAKTETLAEKLGMTQRELETRTTNLKRQQRASISRLQQQQQEQIGAVTGQVEDVKNEVGNVKTDVATAKSDLVATKEKLDHAVGDLGVQSGLIARTREELEVLRRRGERNYHEFALVRGQGPVQVADISLQLKKADSRKSKFTLNVAADDRTIEKKDRNMFEPLQFYTGKDRKLYEVVVFTMEKNKVAGYLSTPKEMVAQAQ